MLTPTIKPHILKVTLKTTPEEIRERLAKELPEAANQQTAEQQEKGAELLQPLDPSAVPVAIILDIRQTDDADLIRNSATWLTQAKEAFKGSKNLTLFIVWAENLTEVERSTLSRAGSIPVDCDEDKTLATDDSVRRMFKTGYAAFGNKLPGF